MLKARQRARIALRVEEAIRADAETPTGSPDIVQATYTGYSNGEYRFSTHLSGVVCAINQSNSEPIQGRQYSLFRSSDSDRYYFKPQNRA